MIEKIGSERNTGMTDGTNCILKGQKKKEKNTQQS